MLGIHGGKLPMSTARPAIVWTIAGSDCGGGAGIQADLATIQDLGCHGCSVITTVTAQSSVAVTLVEPVSAAMLMAQLTTLLSDLPPKAIKIGLLADQTQVALLADWIASFKIHYPSVPVIVDPVMVASCGDALAVDNCQDIKSTAKSALDFNPFKGLIELITPNVLELGRLTHRDVSTKAQFAAAAQALSQSLDCSVLAKGGDVSFGSTDILDDTHAKTHDNTHAQTQANVHVSTLDSNGWDHGLAEDYLVCHQVRASSELHQNGCFWLASQRVYTRHNHGSGCTLSSAIAAVLAQGFVLQDAVVVAKAYVSQGLSAAIGLGQGPGPLARTGWPNDLSRYAKINLCDGNFISHQLNQHLDVRSDLVATVLSATDQATAQVRIVSAPPQNILSHGFKILDADLGVYPVVSDLTMLESLLAAGVKTVQLRIKTDISELSSAAPAESDLGKCESGKSELVGSELEVQIQTAIALGKHFNAQLFINDHWQLAIKYHAFGVHLGQEDLAVTDLAAIQSAGLALGISSHSYFELLLAHQYSPSYIALGHIFPTTTKQMPSAPQGLAKLKHYVALLQDHYPLVAIGGIDLDNLAKVKATGVGNIAVVRAITEAQDPVAAFAELSQAWEQCSLSEELAIKHELDAKHE
ncbi:thiamine phosphate synthase [Shewanella sp. JNE10-2]|uniref:thiamine phosphate synthase n=1 Tax=unclassified Shewanella TaxID=196818 RepID=UPI00200470D1|nr:MULTISPECIES: thiamine phosphate synthase [unclassified Shewanella]MCK7631076.1 thiamine phosphate synthase [Shewanella sp. JNE9-1]MCK7646329.1 thiamine phosphate synthase [Shewanella sp. JNE3-1]MCK7654284.1 thiamine phosphate synthase [Shewanella sp. JNE4-1]UPO26202.1 thiamine phosphate synthase [Shewanella sp. JNE10-2]UPO37188.1 thiamine phosphate synthase [Shewanella sp. JNE7]